MSKRNARVITLAGAAAALAGIGYTLARRSGARAGRVPRVSTRSFRRADVRVNPAAAVADGGDVSLTAAATAATAATSPIWSDAERISSAPDPLDLALDVGSIFDGESASGVAVTARPADHVPAPQTGDDEEAPAPEELGRAWLLQATESERSLGIADTIPDVEGLPRPTTPDDEGESDPDNTDFDETTAEYVRVQGTLRSTW